MSLTAVSALLAMLAILATLTVLAIPTPDAPGEGGSMTWSRQYSSQLLQEPGLRPGVAFALMLLLIPVLALAAQCGRLGAPARDRRLGALRLAGATPGQVVAVVTAETGLASAAGGLLGLVVFLVGRVVLHRPGPDGVLPLPTDVRPSVAAMLLACVALPAAAAGFAAVLLRRVTVTPFGVVRRMPRSRGPRPWPGLLIVLPGATYFGLEPLLDWFDRTMPGGVRVLGPISAWLYHEAPARFGRYAPWIVLAGLVLTAVGVVAGTGWISYTTGRLLHRWSRRPAALLAARRLLADPWNVSRTLAAVLACVLVGGGAAGYRASLATMVAARAESQRRYDTAIGEPVQEYAGDRFYLDAMEVVNLAVTVALVVAALGMLVAITEGIVARRRTYANLVATGVPRAVLARSIVWQAVLPAVPAVAVAAGTGLLLVRGTGTEVEEGGTADVCTATAAVCADPVASAPYTFTLDPVVMPVGVPVVDLAVLFSASVGAVLAVVLIGLVVLRSSTNLEELRTG